MRKYETLEELCKREGITFRPMTLEEFRRYTNFLVMYYAKEIDAQGVSRCC